MGGKGGKSAAENYGAEGRSDVLKLHADKVVLVEEPGHPLYDPRVHRPFHEGRVRSIMKVGVIHPIVVRKNPETGDVECVVGRGRVKAVREANRRLKEQAEEDGTPFLEILIPATVRGKDSEKSLAQVVVAENTQREEMSIVEKAEAAARLRNVHSLTEDELADTLDVTTQTLRSWQAVLDCAPQVRKAIDQGEVAAVVAIELVKLPKEEQLARIETMKTQKKTKGQGAREIARNGTSEGTMVKLTLREWWAVSQAFANGIVSAEDVLPLEPSEAKALVKKLKERARGYKPAAKREAK